MSDLTINFDSIKYNLKKISEGRILSQYANSTLYKLLLGVFTSEIQELSDAIHDLIAKRTIKNAEGKTLDIIGRIVGQSRISLDFDTTFWFAPDTDGSSPDNGHWWVKNAPQAETEVMDDETYRKWIWMKIQKNHNKYSSKPEIEKEIDDGIGEKIAIQRVGMIEQDIYCTQSISSSNMALLSYVQDTTLTENQYQFSYPATTVVNEVEQKIIDSD